jgi:hypothetical protein
MNEENWVGLRGGFGTLQLGRSDTAMKKTGGNHFRAFTDTLAEPSLRPAVPTVPTASTTPARTSPASPAT